MSKNGNGEWTGGWTAESPISIGHVSMPSDAGSWRPSKREGIERRDLELSSVSDGAMSVGHLRARSGQPGNGTWRRHDLDFQFIYVTAGSMTIEDAGQGSTVLEAGGVVHRTGGGWHREISFSDDFEAIEITSPAEFETETSEESPEGAEATGAVVEVSTDARENYVHGAGPRKFFDYRDMGTKEATDGRIHIHVVRATGEPGAGTGWHFHTMAQWFLILGGDSHIRVEDGPDIHLKTGDSMCIGMGPGQRHNVAPFSGDYAVLEMCVPAVYETTPVPAPENAAAGLPGTAE